MSGKGAKNYILKLGDKYGYALNTIDEGWIISKIEFDKVKHKSIGFITIRKGDKLGVHLLSTYIWDADNNLGIFKNEHANTSNNLRNLSYLASIGCNIPLFVSGLPESKIIAIDKRNNEFSWDNYYDRDDVLGWPLKQLSKLYNNLVNDYEINTGQYVGSHVKYWDDNNFTKPLSEKLISIFESM